MTSIKVEENNTLYNSRNNCNAIIETASNTLIVGCANTIIPNGVTSISDNAFGGCSGLTSINIPNSVISIGSLALSFCDNLKKVYCMAEKVPTTGDDVFSYSPVNTATLYVPTKSLNAYKEAAKWKDFGSIISIETVNIQNTDVTKEGQKITEIFTLDGKPLNKLQKGLNIIRMSNGKTQKVVVK